MKVAPKCTKFTAFTYLLGFYEWVLVLFGSINEPVCFPWFMEHFLEGIGDNFVVPCPDDLLLYSVSFEDRLVI